MGILRCPERPKMPSKAMKNRPKNGDESSTGSCPLFEKLMLIISNLHKSGQARKLSLIAGVLPPPSVSTT